MQEVILLKNVGKHKKGDKVTIPIGMANYWGRMGVSKKYVKPKSKTKAKEKSNDKSGATNKGKGKPKS